MLKSIKTLLLFLFIVQINYTNADERIDEANVSLKFLRHDIIKARLDKKIDIQAAEQAIVIITNILNDYSFKIDDKVKLLITRALSIKTINFRRQYYGNEIDITQALQAIEDIEFAVQSNSKYSNRYPSWIYDAGHIAKHLLRDSILAYEYWGKCANLAHAGCMNIMASDSFSGQNGLDIDLDKSIYWHKAVYQTGIDFNCAGIYSANGLREIAYFFPKFKTGHTWLEWIKERNDLFIKLEQKRDDKDLCSMGLTYARDYVLQFGAGIEDIETLEQAIELITDENQKSAIETIKNNTYTTDAIKHLKRIDYDYDQCVASLNLLLFAKYDKQPQAFNDLEVYFNSLDLEVCAWEFALIKRLQGAGQWD